MTEQIGVPDGVEIDLKYYVTSEESGLDMVVTLGGLKSLSAMEDGRAEKGVKELDIAGVNDWRLMTADEVVEYKKLKKEEEDAERRVERGDEDDYE